MLVCKLKKGLPVTNRQNKSRFEAEQNPDGNAYV